MWTARCHIQGAKAILDANPISTASESRRASFLYKAFQYFDVMTALSLHEQPLLAASIAGTETGEIDEIFGLAGSLWPMMHALADLIARRRSGQDVTAEAALLEQRLSSWSFNRNSGSTDVDEEAMLQIAQTYRHSGLLTLHSGSLLEDGSTLQRQRIEETHRAAIDSLLRVCVLSGTMSTLTWPLFTVAMSSTSASDRIVLQHVFSKLLERQHMKVVEGARDKILETWTSEGSSGARRAKEASPEVLLG